MSELRTRLRDETQDLHRLLENTLQLTDTMDEKRMIRALQVLRSPVVQLEALGPDPLPWGISPVQSAWIDEDLTLAGPRTLPLGPLLVSGTPAWVGAHYVHEGSALGSRVVLERLARAGLHSVYFQGLTERMAHWPAFLRYVGQIPETDHDAVVEGARSHFELLCHRASSLS